jgi:hypothetical protein
MSIYVPGKVVLAQQQKIPVVIGAPWGGGYFAGYISHTADGNPTHALIVAPAATGATGTGYTLTDMLQWKNARTSTTGTTSLFDGAANTAAMAAAGIADHPAAQFCVNLSIGGFTDWYLPAIKELDIAYFNLKPTTTANTTVPGYGINDYSVPKRTSNYTASYPAQTYVTAFGGGSEQFVANYHWSSTQFDVDEAWYYLFSNGVSGSFNGFKDSTSLFRTRAFRRIAL